MYTDLRSLAAACGLLLAMLGAGPARGSLMASRIF